jgi:hypothetical protein
MRSMERGAEALCLPEIIVIYLRDEETNMELNGPADGQEKSAPISTRILQNRDENKGKNPGSEDRIPAKDETGPGSTTGPGEPEDKVLTDKTTVIAHPVRNVERKTELQRTSVKLFHEDTCQTRKRTERDLKNPDSEIPYAKTEKAIRDLVCSLMERQDRMNTAIFLEINTLNEDIGMLKDQLYKLRTVKTPATTVVKK